MIRVVLPSHLKVLARVEGDVCLNLAGAVTLRRLLDALEACHPVLRGSIREHATGHRRKLIRFFACGEDWSHEDPDRPLPPAVQEGREPVLIVGAIAGG